MSAYLRKGVKTFKISPKQQKEAILPWGYQTHPMEKFEDRPMSPEIFYLKLAIKILLRRLFIVLVSCYIFSK